MGEEVADSEDFEISPNSLGPVGTVNNVQVPLPSTGVVNNVQVPSQKISGHMRSHGHRKNNRPTSKVAQHYSGQKIYNQVNSLCAFFNNDCPVIINFSLFTASVTVWTMQRSHYRWK